MKKRNELNILNQTIVFLQDKQVRELELLHHQLRITTESLRPLSIIKSTFREVTSNNGIKSDMVNNVIGLAMGYLSKKVLLGRTRNPIKRVIGTILEFAIANVVAKHSDKIKSTGKNVLQNILNHKTKINHEHTENGH